jgi:hypothetical protein
MNCRSLLILLILLMHCMSVGLAQGRQEERNYNKIVAGRISDEGLPSGIRRRSLLETSTQRAQPGTLLKARNLKHRM